MSSTDELDQLKEVLTKSSQIMILMGNNPTYDVVASSLGLLLPLLDKGKDVVVACPSEMRVEFSKLVGLNKVVTKLGNRNLVVSFDYIQDSIEKVSYHVKEDKFNLVVQPKEGLKPLDSSNVSYSYSGASAELVFIVGASSFESLGSLYEGEKSLFDNTHTVSVGVVNVTPFAKTTIVDVNASSTSEVMYSFSQSLGLNIGGDAASNLLAGIDNVTGRFGNSNVPVSAFEAAAKLMSSGAKRLAEVNEKKSRNVNYGSNNDLANVLTPMSKDASAKSSPPIEDSETGDQTPKDWLEPKIYKGTTRV